MSSRHVYYLSLVVTLMVWLLTRCARGEEEKSSTESLEERQPAPEKSIVGDSELCEKQEVLSVGEVSIWELSKDSTFFYEAGMAIDADGAPKAYHPEDIGLDSLSNAGQPGNWFGIITDNEHDGGNPIIQGPDDPAPGYYVSSTSLEYTTQERTSLSRYVDSTKIPYIVLPPEVMAEDMGQFRAELGDFAVVINRQSGQLAEAIFTDKGPREKIGEGSIALADALGIPSNPRRGGVEQGVIYVVFPGSGNGQPRGIDEITAESDSLFEAFGGMEQIDTCFLP
jgi:hypothetical protein